MSAAQISTYIGQFFSGGVEESTPHLILILAAVIGGLAVGIGIIWESARTGHLWTLPTALVVIGVVVEAAATVVLFEFDEGISRAQNSTIIALESHRHLSDGQKERLSLLAKKFPSQNFLTVSAFDAESWDFAREIGRALSHDGWHWISCDDGPLGKWPKVNGEPRSCWLLAEAQIQIEGTKESAEIREAIAGALKEPSMLGAAIAIPETNDQYSTLAIIVGTKT